MDEQQKNKQIKEDEVVAKLIQADDIEYRKQAKNKKYPMDYMPSDEIPPSTTGGKLKKIHKKKTIKKRKNKCRKTKRNQTKRK